MPSSCKVPSSILLLPLSQSISIPAKKNSAVLINVISFLYVLKSYLVRRAPIRIIHKVKYRQLPLPLGLRGVLRLSTSRTRRRRFRVPLVFFAFGRVRKIAKATLSCVIFIRLSVFPHGTNRIPLDGF